MYNCVHWCSNVLAGSGVLRPSYAHLGSSTNNQSKHPNQEPTPVTTQPITRDPVYYFEDANTVLLVDKVLFRIQLSLLAPDSAPKDLTFDSRIRVLTSNFRNPITNRGTNDQDAVLIPRVKARQFRHFLLALMGRPGSPEYVELLTGTIDTKRIQDSFVRYLDIGTLALRFGLHQLTTWAGSQLLQLFPLANRLSSKVWDKATLLQALEFGNCWGTARPFAIKTQALVQFILTPSISKHLPAPNSPNLGICVSFYKDPGFPNKYPQFFGWIVAVILSRGHLSDTWLGLGPRSRLALYAVQAQLLEYDSGQSCAAARLVPLLAALDSTGCSRCSDGLSAAKKASFGLLGDLKSEAPLDYIRHIAELPYYNQKFVDSVGFYAIDSGCTSCGSDYYKNLLDKVNREVQSAFGGLTDLHTRFISDIKFTNFKLEEWATVE